MYHDLITGLLCFFPGVVQGIVTGIRGLCNGIGPAMFGFTFYLFHVNLDELPTTATEVSANQTMGMEDPFRKVCMIQLAHFVKILKSSITNSGKKL
jgi:hypothetical protein